MRLVLLHKEAVAIANRVAANSLWKAGRPYLCVPMRKNGNVYHIIPFRTSKRKPYVGLTNTLFFPLKRNMGKNAAGEYPHLDFSKSFLVRKHHFYDLPPSLHVEGYMRAAAGLGTLTGMSRKYIAKMNAGGLDGVRQRYCVDYVAILRSLDEQLPPPRPLTREKRQTKQEREIQQQKSQTYADIDAELAVRGQAAPDVPNRTGDLLKAPPAALQPASGKVLPASEREQTYAEIETELRAGNAEQAANVRSEATVPPPPVVQAAAKKAKPPGAGHLYGTTMADIRASQEAFAMERWLDDPGWQQDFKQREMDDVYDAVEVVTDPAPADVDILKEMREEVYGETVGAEDGKPPNDDVDA